MAQAAIEKGQVLVEGAVCQETGHSVSEATRDEWDKDRRAIPRPRRLPSPFPVLYQDEHVLVVGAEGKGLHEQVKKHCDFLVRIPLAGNLASLNVSVATGVALFEWKRRYGH